MKKIVDFGNIEIDSPIFNITIESILGSLALHIFFCNHNLSRQFFFKYHED